ncbi:hypothetical protein ACFX2I_030810 [Malus domestica]
MKRILDLDAIRNGIWGNHNGMSWREKASDSIRSGASRKRWRVGEEELELLLRSEVESNGKRGSNLRGVRNESTPRDFERHPPSTRG